LNLDPVDRVDKLTHLETSNKALEELARTYLVYTASPRSQNERLRTLQSARRYRAAYFFSIHISITIYLVTIKSVLESESEAVRNGASGMDAYAICDGDGSTWRPHSNVGLNLADDIIGWRMAHM
jgi:hypothetical protein